MPKQPFKFAKFTNQMEKTSKEQININLNLT